MGSVVRKANQFLTGPFPQSLSQFVILTLANEMLAIYSGGCIGRWVVQEKFFFMNRKTAQSMCPTEVRYTELFICR